jgi:hypothetical protein
MNMIWRDDASDTGEQDVRELRQRHAETAPAPRSEPHLRDKEDVPHEGSLADFYGLEDDGIEAELSALVDAGELCMGWDSETQEVVYWLPEVPELVEQPAPEPRSRRARKPRKRSSIYRRTVLALAASVAPLLVGMAAEAAVDMHADSPHPMDQPDMAGAEVPTPSATVQAATTTGLSNYRPTGSSYQLAARHAKVTTSPTVEKPGSYVGKHRKALGKHIAESAKASRKTESKTPRHHLSGAPRPSVAPPSRTKQDPNTPAEHVVNSILGPVESLLK